MKKFLAIPFLAVFLIAGTAHAQAQLNVPSGENTSTNWAGYVAQGSDYTGVGATWVVPTPATSSGSVEADATWVGVGGVTSNDLIQAGTQAMTENGSISYQVWYETLPNVQTVLPMTVNGGDSVTVSMNEDSNHLWTINFNDNTTGATYSVQVSYQSSNSSAEWIEERPIGVEGNAEGYFPLDNFGTVDFTNAYGVENGNTNQLSAGTADAQPLSMTNNSEQVLATPSSLEDNGTAFLVTRETSPTQSFTPSQSGSRYQGQGGRSWRRTSFNTQTFTVPSGTSKTYSYNLPGGSGSVTISVSGLGAGENFSIAF